MTFLRDLGLLCGAIVAIITALTLVSKLPPIQWLWRHLVSGPLSTWAALTIKRGAMEFHEETVRPQINAIEEKVNVIAASEYSWSRDKAWIVGRLSQVELRTEQIDTKQNELISGVTAVLEKGDLPPGDLVAGVTDMLQGMSRPRVGEQGVGDD